MKELLAAGVRASNLGITLLDSQTRWESLNAALARETRIPIEQHIGRNTREIVGDLAGQIEPTYEKVLRTGKPGSAWIVGHVRDTPEIGYWFDYCFPIFDKSRRVQQLGLFVVNVTAERTSTEILNALAASSKVRMAQATGTLERFDESVRAYHSNLRLSLSKLACPTTEAGRRADSLRLSLEHLDEDIRLMQELLCAVIAQLPVPEC
jgi:PAS domain-containing protein